MKRLNTVSGSSLIWENSAVKTSTRRIASNKPNEKKRFGSKSVLSKRYLNCIEQLNDEQN